MYDLNQLTQILIDRLGKKGMKPNIIPGFIRNLLNIILVNPHTSLFQLNYQLHLLGWDDFELDYRTLELATACFEFDGLKGLKNKPVEHFLTDLSSASKIQ